METEKAFLFAGAETTDRKCGNKEKPARCIAEPGREERKKQISPELYIQKNAEYALPFLHHARDPGRSHPQHDRKSGNAEEMEIAVRVIEQRFRRELPERTVALQGIESFRDRGDEFFYSCQRKKRKRAP